MTAHLPGARATSDGHARRVNEEHGYVMHGRGMFSSACGRLELLHAREQIIQLSPDDGTVLRS